MKEMVLLKCESESKMAVVLCPQCARISRQVLKAPYSPMREAELVRPHSCPVCGAAYESCSLNGAENYRADFARYNNAPAQYNDAVRDNYAQKQKFQPAPANTTSTTTSNTTSSINEQRQNLANVMQQRLDQQRTATPSAPATGASKSQSTIPVPHTAIPLWQDLFSTTILGRGRTYYNAGRVKNLSKNNACHSAVVTGTEEYNVVISYEGDKIASMTCNCPYAQSGERCKHMAAVLYAAYGDGSIKRTSEPIPEEKSDAVSAPVVTQSIQEKTADTISIPVMKTSATPASDVETPYQELDRKIDFWKRELLDTGKRNKMINYRETKRSTLKILEPSAEELFNQLAVTEKTLTFQKPISKETDIRTYSLLSLLETLSYSLPVTRGDIKTDGTIVEREKTLKNLRSKAKLAREEQGTNILYLCFGFIYWREHDRDSSPWMKSPLLMMPVTLGLKSLNAPYTLTKGDDEIEVNPTLDYLFNAEYNIDLPTFELKNKSSFAEYLRTIEEIVDRRGWKVVPEVSLGLLSFLKISMYHDLNNNREMMINNPVLRAMAGDRTAIGDIPAAAQNYDFDKADPKDWHEVVNSDSSQEEAILLSKLGVSFVMQGPPGTGKSQTITNIIAEAMADGKKVLFVSEKAAALQVVLKRLTEVGLSDFCLSLHNYKANKKEIIDSIGANLSLQPEYVGDSVLRELTELFHDRQYLDTYADELHQAIAPLGDSIYMVFGKLSKLETASVVEFSLEKPMEISKEQYASLLYCISAFEKALQNLDGPLSENPWYGTKATSSGQTYKQQLMAATGALSEELHEIDQLATELNEEYHTAFPHTWTGIKEGNDELGQALALPMFTTDWLESAARARMLSTAKFEYQEQQKYYAACETFREVLDTSVLDAPIDTWLDQAKTVADNLAQLGFNTDYSMAPFSKAITNREPVTALIGTLKSFLDQCQVAEKTAGIGGRITFAKAEKLYTLISLLEKKRQYVHPSWFAFKTLNKLSTHLPVAKTHAASLQKANDAIAADWNDSVYEIDASKISEYFGSEYAWIYQQSGDVGALLDSEIKNANALLSEISSLLNATKEAYSLLHYSGADSVESITMLCNVLSLIVEAPYMEADWFDPRKNADILPKINEAMKVCASVREKSDALLVDWEPTVFSIDADGMLARFKTEYTGFLHKMKGNYKEDIKTIKLNAKAVGKAIDEPQIVALLQQIKEVNEEKKWFDTHSAEMAALLGSRYKGFDTDWVAVQKSMQVALQIAALFPYGSIPVETIHAIRAITESLQLTGDAKRICEQISISNIEHCSTIITDSKFVAGFVRSSSLNEEIIPQINSFIQNGGQQRLYIEQFKNAKKTSSLSYEEINELLSSLIIVKQEEDWFEENAETNRELFAALNQGKNSDWDTIEAGLELTKTIKGLFEDNVVPDAVVAYACAEVRDENTTLTIAMLNPAKIDEYKHALLKIAPQWNTDKFDIPKMIENLEAYGTAAGTISSVIAEIRGYVSTGSISAEELLSKVANAKDARFCKQEIEKREQNNSELFGNRYVGIDTEWTTLQQDITAVDAVVMSKRTVTSDNVLTMIANDFECREKLSSLHARLSELVTKTMPEIGYFQEQFENADFTGSELTAIADRYDACLNGFGELNKWLDYVETRAECDKYGLADFTAKLAAADNSIPDVRAAFERGFYHQWIGLAMDTVPAVQSFRRRVHEQRIDRFVKTDEKQYALSQKRIRDRIISTYPRTNQMAKAGSELGILRHEMEKKRRIMPIRKLFQSIPNLLLTLKPCLMMSPLSVAYFLEAGSYQFDMVIFDEASQIFPQDAIGAIFRAKQVVIAGDTKQLPPTSFFASSTGNGDDAFDDEDSYEDEVYDSILEETANILPNRTLLWHYRSKHEHLIAFSNQEIYKGELVTFPSSNESERDTGVEFVYVEDGYYEGGGKNCNILEARRIVQLIKEHIDRHPTRSLGVIAFSEKQQNAIALEVQRFREKNSEYEEFFAEGKEDEFFIKNLENVQGDERDTIIFSVGYAKTKEQKANNKPMAMRFGPLGVQGGERRLNVAITRAKTNIKLVSSILPSDIDLSRTESDGVRMLRSYIEFAMNGDATLAAARANAKPDDFVDAVAKFLTEHGYKVSQYVGCSGYKIDIAVEHPSEVVHQFAAGIECDGYSYASSRTARDRDRLRGSVLKNMGWNMYRVWSAEWYKNPEIEGEKLLAFIKSAIDECDKKVKAIEEEKRKAEEALRKAEEAKRKEQERIKAEQEAAERKRLEEAAQREAEAKAAKEAKRREAAQRQAAQEEARREAARKQWEEERRRKEAEQKAKTPKVDISWVKKEALVKHKSFGIGSVKKIEDGYINIAFPAGEKRFAIPSAFETGFLTRPAPGENTSSSANTPKQPARTGSKSPAELIRELAAKGFTCIDNRSTSGIVWVLYSSEKKTSFETMVAGYNVQYKLEKRGAMATKNAPAWRIMFN